MPSILTTVVYSPTGNLYGNVNRQSRRPPPPTQLTSNPHYTPSGLLPQKTTKTTTETKEKGKKNDTKINTEAITDRWIFYWIPINPQSLGQ
jgi:hypothetical protein